MTTGVDIAGSSPGPSTGRRAHGGILIAGGGFAGAWTARLLGTAGATLVNAENAMLFTPMLPEAASGTLEFRHVVVPLRMMCPHAELIIGRVVTVDAEAKTARVCRDDGTELDITFDHVVVAVGAITRTLPIPGLAEHAIGAKTAVDDLVLRNEVLRQIDLAAVSDADERDRRLTFVVVGGGYAGVETIAELAEMASEAVRFHAGLQDAQQRWILVDAGDRVLADIPSRLGEYAAHALERQGIDVRCNTRLEKITETEVTFSDGTTVPAGMVVWTAGVKAHPIMAEWGLPLDRRGRVEVEPTLQVRGYEHVWAAGDCAAVPNAATPETIDPPTSQHALRQAKRLAANLRAAQAGRPPEPYRFKALGQVATLGRHRGIADLMGIKLTGWVGWVAARGVHWIQIAGASRRFRVLADWIVGAIFRRDIVAFSALNTLRPQAGAAAGESSVYRVSIAPAPPPAVLGASTSPTGPVAEPGKEQQRYG
jgi:NADH:ubiquinone reductase (H+-translocating)